MTDELRVFDIFVTMPNLHRTFYQKKKKHLIHTHKHTPCGHAKLQIAAKLTNHLTQCKMIFSMQELAVKTTSLSNGLL